MSYLRIKENHRYLSRKFPKNIQEEEIIVPLDIRLRILNILHQAVINDLKTNELVENILNTIGGRKND